MGVLIVTTYRFDCDWPRCRAALTLHQATSLEDATERARRDRWTSSATRRRGRVVRCPDHAYEYTGVRRGRPPRRRLCVGDGYERDGF